VGKSLPASNRIWYEAGMKRVLVSHQGALGDIILSFPALIQLKRQRDVRLDLLCAHQIGRLAQDLNVVDDYYATESRKFCCLFQADRNSEASRFLEPYDGVILIGRSSMQKAVINRHYRGEVFQISSRPGAENQFHVADHVMRGFLEQGLIAGRGENAAALVAEGVGDTTDRERFQKRWTLVIHPGAGSERKHWHVGNFVDVAGQSVARGIGPILFLMGPAEEELARFFEQEMGCQVRSSPEELDDILTGDNVSEDRYVCFQTEDLSRVVRVLQRSGCFLGNDSGVTHLAAYLGLPTVALFGPSSPLRWSPVGRNVTVVRGVNDCPPCFETAQSNCEDPRCLSEISFRKVSEAMERALTRSGLG